MSFTVEDIDRGYKRIVRDLRLLGKMETKVGVFGHGGSPETDVAARATVNEFGSPRRGIPSRPFMRASFDDNLRALARRSINPVKAVLDQRTRGLQSVKRQVGLVGEWFAGRIKEKIRSGPWVANAPLTVLRKGSSRPLIDRGEMRNAVTHREVVR